MTESELSHHPGQILLVVRHQHNPRQRQRQQQLAQGLHVASIPKKVTDDERPPLRNVPRWTGKDTNGDWRRLEEPAE